jgi:uncharacterized repeat protein (TIGR03803 family)
LINVDGTLYGTTMSTRYGLGNGTVFSISTTGVKKVLYGFKGGVSDGAQPVGALIDVNGTLYGATAQGGGSGCFGRGCGTIYSVSTSGSEEVLYSFKGGSDGAYPIGGLIEVNGTLYGTTLFGGSNVRYCGNVTNGTPGCGTVYSVSTTGAERVLYSFAGGSDGADPEAGLVDVKGTLYGTTESGGAKCGGYTLGCGTVYSVTTSGSENVLYRFKGSRLAAVIPTGGLLYVRGMLYGTTGSPDSAGSVYKISLTGAHKVVYYFQGAPDGAKPSASLIAVNGMLYGTTVSGGVGCTTSSDRGCGTIFSVTTSGKETVLHSFLGVPNGAYPMTSLTDVKLRLFGTTLGGGCDGGCGTVFALPL